jgi:hypothetical protein
MLVLASGITPAVAADALTPADTALPDATIDQRIRFIEERLEARKTHAQIWYWGWLVVNAGSTIGLGISAGITNDYDDRINDGVMAGVAALGVADVLLRPLEARLGAAPIRGLPEATREDKIAKLRAAESQLRANARRAEERTSWVMHAANFGLSAASGVAIGLAGNAKDAAISSASNFVGGILYLLTEPAGPKDDWHAYEVMSGRTSAGVEPQLVLTGGPTGAGIGLRYTW